MRVEHKVGNLQKANRIAQQFENIFYPNDIFSWKEEGEINLTTRKK